jgi:hypothetical protein
MLWTVESKASGKWEAACDFRSREQARLAARGGRYLNPGGKYRVRKTFLTEVPPKLGEGLDEGVLADLSSVLGIDIKAHMKVCTRSCGVVWLANQFKLAGLWE